MGDAQAGTLHQLVTSLASPDDTERVLASFRLFQQCSESNPQFAGTQTLAGELGAVERLLEGAAGVCSDQCRLYTFAALAQLAFNHEGNAGRAASHPLFQQAVTASLEPHLGEVLRFHALRTLQNVSYMSFDSHPVVLGLLAVLTRTSAQDQPPRLRAQASQILHNLTLRPASRGPLLRSGVCGALVGIVREDGDLPDGGTVVACMALANLLPSHPHPPTIHAALGAKHEAMVLGLRECLVASLQDQDFPHGSAMFFSAWEVALALSNLSTVHTLKGELLRAGMAGALRDALVRCDDPRLTRLCLRTLWNLGR